MLLILLIVADASAAIAVADAVAVAVADDDDNDDDDDDDDGSDGKTQLGCQSSEFFSQNIQASQKKISVRLCISSTEIV